MDFDQWRGRVFTVILLCVGLSWGVNAEPLAVEELARLPQIQQPSLSHDGRYLVALVSTGEDAEKPSLAVYDLDDPSKGPVIANADKDSEFIAAIALKAGKVWSIARKPYIGETFGCDGEFVTGISRTFTFQSFLSDADLSDFDNPFTMAGLSRRSEDTQRCLKLGLRGQIAGNLLPLDDSKVVMFRQELSSFRLRYEIVDLATGKAELLFKDSNEVSAGLIDPRDLTVWTKNSIDPSGSEYLFRTHIRNAETGDYEIHEKLTWSTKERHTVEVVGRDEESGKFYVVTDQFSDKARVYLYDALSREYDAEPAFAHSKYSASGVILGRTQNDYNKLLGFRYFGDIVRTHWVDTFFAQVQVALQGAFPGEDVQITDYSADKSRILFRVETSRRPPRYFIFQDTQRLVPVGDSAPWIDTEGLNATSLIYYEARDGMRIPGLMTLPAHWSRGDAPPPAVVLPHGGPWARDFAGWDVTGWVQYFASRGFTVLQPQYRGSTQFGRSLWMAGDAEWGLKMQDDKDDGAQWLVENGYADAQKIIMFGYSYGGFAAFAASVRENGPFQCAIAGAGVSDLENIGNNWSRNRLQRILQGRTVKGMSPLENADKINMPILIIHGDRDVRVPISHAEKFYRQVKDKTAATYVVVEDMPHSLPWTPQQQRKALNAIDNFLATDCKL